MFFELLKWICSNIFYSKEPNTLSGSNYFAAQFVKHLYSFTFTEHPKTKIKQMLKKILIGLLIAGAVAAGYGYYLFNLTEKSLTDVKADHSTDVTSFLQEYESDETASDAKYLGKIVEVKGKIDNVRTDENGQVKISFESDNPMATVLAEMDQAEKDKALKLTKGNEVTIRGKCTGKLSDIVCVNCVIK